MIRLSSNMTLILKVFVPVFWTTIFGLFFVMLFVADEEKLGVFAFEGYRYGYIAFFVVFLLFMYCTIMQLLRVETDNSHIYITNYFKTYRYALEDIEKIDSYNLFLVRLVRLRFHQKTYFGRHVYFVAKKATYSTFAREQGV